MLFVFSNDLNGDEFWISNEIHLGEVARQNKNSCKICSFIELLIRLLLLETNDCEDSISHEFEVVFCWGMKLSTLKFIALKFLLSIFVWINLQEKKPQMKFKTIYVAWCWNLRCQREKNSSFGQCPVKTKRKDKLFPP